MNKSTTILGEEILKESNIDRKARAERAEAMRKDREKAERKQRNLISVGIVVVVTILIGAAAWGISSISKENKKNEVVIEPRNLVDNGVPFIPSNNVTVAKDAPLVEVFEDFLCTACGQFDVYMAPTLKNAASAGEIELRFMPFSFLHNASTNDYSRRAMNLAMCVVDKDGPEAFWNVKASLFANQPEEGGPGHENAKLLELAKGAGVTGIDSCVKTERFVPWIDKIESKFSKERNFRGTPAMYINGKESTARTPEDFAAEIAAASK